MNSANISREDLEQGCANVIASGVALGIKAWFLVTVLRWLGVDL